MKQFFLYTLVVALILYGSYASGQPQVGDVAPDFTVTDTEGHMHTLSEYTGNGQFVMLDFFFTTCIPCQYYTPQISLAYETYGCNEGDIVILGIDYNDTDAEVIQYEQTYGGIYPSASGLDGGGNAVVAEYGIFAFPFVCLIDTENIVVEIFEIPTMQVFSYYFGLYGIAEMECNTGIQEIYGEGFLSFSPNPVQEILKISAPAGSYISIYSADGQMVEKFFMASSYTEHHLSGLGTGLYFVRAEYSGKQACKKMIISN